MRREGTVGFSVVAPFYSYSGLKLNRQCLPSSSLDRYRQSLDWLKEWACTRQFGLGTKLPWEEEWVIESLSDSTIYMAFYAIAGHLQGVDNLDGRKGSPAEVDPKKLTSKVFNCASSAGRSSLRAAGSTGRSWRP